MKTQVLDGNYYLYRAYYASFKAGLKTSTGLPSGVVKFMYNMLTPLVAQQDNLIAVFDAETKNFRYDFYPEYKANRKPCPPDLAIQKKDVRNLCRALGLPVIMIDGVEADDVLGTLARHYTRNEQNLTILTGDKDLEQFLSSYVTLFDSKANKLTTVATLMRDKGITPKQVTYYLALCGDSVDNVPGVPGIAQKKALSLLQQFGTLKAIAQNAPNIKGALGKTLVDNMDSLRLSYKLVRCKTDLELDHDKLLRKPINQEKLDKVLTKYEIKVNRGGKGLFG